MGRKHLYIKAFERKFHIFQFPIWGHHLLFHQKCSKWTLLHKGFWKEISHLPIPNLGLTPFISPKMFKMNTFMKRLHIETSHFPNPNLESDLWFTVLINIYIESDMFKMNIFSQCKGPNVDVRKPVFSMLVSPRFFLERPRCTPVSMGLALIWKWS